MPQPHPDYYKVLGVEPTATIQEIGRAFRRAMRACHPDRFPNDPEREKRAQQLSAARSVLSDPTRRAAFDASRKGRAPPPPPPPPKSSAGAPPPAADAPTRAPWVPSTPRPRGSRLAVEFKGMRWFVERGWRITVTKMLRKAMTSGERKAPAGLKIAKATYLGPGSVVVEFSYGRSRGRKTRLPPETARFFWGKVAR